MRCVQMTVFQSRYARAHAKRGNIAGVAGQVAEAVMEEAHAVMCERGEWICNEKRLIETAGLGRINSLFSEIPADRERLVESIDRVADWLGVSRSESTPWKRDGN